MSLTIFYYINYTSNIFSNQFSLWAFLLNFSIAIFFLGFLWLLLNYKNFLITLLCIELMYFGMVISFILVSLFLNDPAGQVYALLLVILAAAESAIGLGILIVLYKFGGSIAYKTFEKLAI